MKKMIALILLSLLILTGCGGGSEGSGSTDNPRNNTNSAVSSDVGKTDGKYNLWEYMTPTKNTTNSFVETKGETTSTYKTTYSISPTTVTETSDYAQNEKTIYTKKSDRVTVSFEKDGTPNGSYDLDLTANIGDMVTIKESTCILANHYDKVKISDKYFTDVIEIKCSDKPGYYQKGVGEIAQTNALSTNGSRSVRILSN
jgi:hypothetical protein